MASLEKMLQEVTGFDDVADFLVALKSMAPEAVSEYLTDAFGVNVLNDAIAAALGAASLEPAEQGGFYRKKKDDDEGRSTKNTYSKSEPQKGRVPGGGVTVVSHEKKKGSRRNANTTAGLDSLNRALRPGRHLCTCNARRHALLYNCLSCGKVICEQEGEGACLFCGEDPHAQPSAALRSDEATRRKERLLEFDRSAAKRTTVIDDQVALVPTIAQLA